MKSSFLLWAASLAPCFLLAAPPFAPFLENHCAECHDSEVKKGGLDVSTLSLDGNDEATHRQWVRIYDRVQSGEMPPAKRRRPLAEEQTGFLKSLGASLTASHQARKSTVLRRLNRQEYQNTLHQLLGVSVNVVDLLPEDGRVEGFDNVGEALSISGIQMQRYMEAAGVALDAALLCADRPQSKTETFTLNSERNRNQNRGKQWLWLPDGSIVVFNNGGFPSTEIPNLKAPAEGTYRLKISGYGYQIQEPVVFAVMVGNFNRGGDVVVNSFHELPPNKFGTVELKLHLRLGDGIKISPQGLNGPQGRSPVKDGPDKYPGEGLALKEVVLEGPLVAEWPPRGQSLLLGQAKVTEVPPKAPWMRTKPGYKPTYSVDVAEPAAEVVKQLPQFLSAAFRRPVGADEALPYVKLAHEEMATGADFIQAMRTAAVAALCSPDFLFLHEDKGALSSPQIATRLSYFLTRAAPEKELLASDLKEPSVLRNQTERLLNSQTLERFIADFTDGWLNLREIDFTTPDKILYPEYDELLLDSMLRETRAFISHLLQENLPVRSLIHSDFAMLNARLARHYGVPGISGMTLQKVKLPLGSRRGGILTHASILKVSANGTNTSPVVRGVWVNERLLGIKPAPPPPGIPGVEPDIRGANTLRELLARHRSMESCNGCHSVIDPPGFALESYDVIGGWRDRFRSLDKGDRVSLQVEGRNVRYKLGPPVDATGQMPSGATFADLDGLKQILLQSEDKVVHCVTEKLLTFATGRAMGFSDRAEISAIAAKCKAQGSGLRHLVHAVVQSIIFTHK